MSADAMHVMHVMEAMHRGGAESLILEHIRHAAPGVRVSVCALNRGGPALEAAAALGARTYLLGRDGGPLRAVTRFGMLASLMRREKVDVVNGHNPTGALYAIVAACLAGVRARVRTEHSLHYRGRHSVAYPLIERIVTACSRSVVCVCQAVLESHARRLPWAARRFVTVANGISSAPHTRPRHAVRDSLGLAADARVVVTVGSLTTQKAQHVLLDAFAAVAAAVPNARLVVAGEGPLRGDLEASIEERGLAAAVHLLGDREDVADLIEASDVFTLSSIREGLPVTLLEAMRGGRPSVVTRIGGMPEVVEEGVTGFVVAPGDASAMAEALRVLIADPGRALDMGRAARARWEQHYSAARMVEETEAIYHTLLGRPAPAGTSPRGEASHAAS